MTIRAALVLLALLAPAAAWAQAQGEPSPLPDRKPLTGRPGIGVDFYGGQVVDPTKNVGDLVGAMKEMFEKLRLADRALLDAMLKAERDLNEMRARGDRDLLKAATDRLESEAKLRAEHQALNAQLETARVNAIRLVDKSAVDATASQAVATATGLAKAVQDAATSTATQTARLADDLRILVKTTADEANRSQQQAAAAIQAQLGVIGTRLTTLEQTGAGRAGEAKFQDPALANALAALTAAQQKTDATLLTIATQRAQTTGASEGQAYLWALIAGGIGLAITIMMFFFKMMDMRRPAEHVRAS